MSLTKESIENWIDRNVIGDDYFRNEWKSSETEVLNFLQEDNVLTVEYRFFDDRMAIGEQQVYLFDVLEYISYARQPISRSDRANQARRQVLRLLNDKQNEFIEFILSNYVKEGIDELDIDRLGISLQARYGSTNQAKKELGDLDSIKSVFIEFQQYLYKAA